MSHSHIVADELHNAGFRTKVLTSNAVQVSLSNRKPSTMEVWITLREIFEDITFTVKSLVDTVLVYIED